MKSLRSVSFVLATGLMALAMVSCGSTQPAAPAPQGEVAVLWGTYEISEMPTPNPDVFLSMTVVLSEDWTFEFKSWPSHNPDAVTEESGSFTWQDEEAGVIELGLANENSPLRLYRVLEGFDGLLHLMPNGNEFPEPGLHTLQKAHR